jgi:DNA integrity scanning protein DisA with diadenylate cyclase activity
MKKKKKIKKIEVRAEQLKNLGNDLNEEQQLELLKLSKEIAREAKLMVDDYAKNPSELSGSLIEIHQDSPFLEDGDTNEDN